VSPGIAVSIHPSSSSSSSTSYPSSDMLRAWTNIISIIIITINQWDKNFHQNTDDDDDDDKLLAARCACSEPLMINVYAFFLLETNLCRGIPKPDTKNMTTR
jgi:hypothetical protein